MALNFNTDPYYDDFDPNKNFHRILFKPGYSVQARELTQSQTILQNQISQFADAIFKQNTPVSGGQVTTNLRVGYLKLNPSYNDEDVVAENFLNRTVQNAYGNVVARVVATAEATDADPYPTLMLNYFTGTTFANNSLVTISDAAYSYTANSISSGATGLGSIATIANGVFYIVNGYSYSDTLDSNGNPLKYSIGNFVNVVPQTIILSKYSNTPNVRIGLEITETIYDYVNDTSLLDPAIGASNYQAPGADRYVVDVSLTTKPLEFGDDQNFIELARVESGVIVKQINETEYSKIDDYFAKRTYETNGDYVVNNFKLTPKLSAESNNWNLSIGPGLAYVHGFRVENQSPLTLTSTRARSADAITLNNVFMNYGNFLYVDGFSGNNSSFIDISSASNVDLHLVSTNNVRTSNATTYNSTVAASAYVRSIDYVTATGSTANTYVYKLHLFDISNKVLSGNISSANASSITISDTVAKFTSANDAYNGVLLTIDSGTGSGQSTQVSAYNGISKTLSLSPSLTIAPTSASKFSLKFGVKDTETIIRAANTGSSFTLYGSANVNNLSRTNNYYTGEAVLENPSAQELLFTIGNPYVANLSSQTYTTQISFRNQAFSGSTPTTTQITLGTGSLSSFTWPFSGTLSADTVRNSFIVMNSTTGALIDFTTSGRTVVVAGNQATFTATDLSAFTALIICQVAASHTTTGTDPVFKVKTLVNTNSSANGAPASATTVGNTRIDLTNAQVYISAGDIKNSDTKQSLYVADVKNIVKILDTKGQVPTTSMYTNSSYDVTSNYLFNNGQTDNYYGHSYITLRPGAPKPTALWIYFDYYSHTGGDGYFTIDSYTSGGESYANVGTYTASTGKVYELSDVIDFRPALVNAQNTFIFRYSTSSNEYGLRLPIDLSSFIHNYYYYLGRKDSLVITKDKSFKLVQGVPSLNPDFPTIGKDDLLLAKITLDPYTAFIQPEITSVNAITAGATRSNLSIEPVKHKTYRMQDISNIEERINNLEYYTSLNLVEQGATGLQITDANGLNRFKNGILVDDFSTFGVADSYNTDFTAAIDIVSNKLMPSIVVKNYPLRNYLLSQTKNSPSASELSAINYTIHQLGSSNIYSLKYTESSVVSQIIASTAINVNSSTISNAEGTVEIYPTMDNWIDSTKEPAAMFIDPTITQYRSVDTVNVLDGDPTLAIGSWKLLPGTKWEPTTTISTTEEKTPVSGGSSIATRTVQLGAEQVQNIYTTGKWAKTTDASLNYVTNVSLLPYIRRQFIEFRARDLLIKTKVNAFFDNQPVSGRIRSPNILSLTGVSGTFRRGSAIGKFDGSNYIYTGFILDIYTDPATPTNVKLYISGDDYTTSYTGTTTTVYAITSTSAGVNSNSGASGTLSSSTINSGLIGTTGTTNQVTLSASSSSVTDAYVGLKFAIVGPTESSIESTTTGSPAYVTAYNGTTKVATLSRSVTIASLSDVYSFLELETNEVGSICGIFYCPGNTFNTGSREFVIDNRTVDVSGTTYTYNQGTETTYAKTTFFAQGLSTKTQQVNFSPSIQNPQTVTTTDNRVKYSVQTTTSDSIFVADPVNPNPPGYYDWNVNAGEHQNIFKQPFKWISSWF